MAANGTGKKSPAQLNRKLQKTPIAIVGMSALFPESKDLTSYWENILSEADCIREVPEDRWSIEDYYDPDKTKPDKTYSKSGGFIPGVEFNPIEWGLPPNILEVTDVAQLLSLVMAKRVLEDAGYGEGQREFDKEHTGCILGVGGGQKLMNPLLSRLQGPVWERVLASEGIAPEDRAHIIEKMKKAYVRWEEMSFPGTLGNVIAGRIANRLDLGSTNCVVDAACASSLAGIRMAISDLLEYRSNMMITGGVDTDNSIYMYLCFSKTPAFTANETLQPFDKNSAGIMIGEGIGMLALKRLEDAEADGDKIYAVIKGIGSSSDGRFKSIYAPRAEGQIKALERAYEAAGVDPQTVGLWEAHGTGTKAGDATEAKALSDFIGKGEQKTLALGSVKSQMGHTKNAAGAAGIIKSALALHHKVLPATINVTEPNPGLGLDGTPAYLNTETRPWVRPEGAPPRRAGVSAFGFGGTNFHYVLEEYSAQPKAPFRLHKSPEALFLSAPDRAGLIQALKEKQAALKGDQSALAFYQWAQESQAIQIPKSHARIGLVAKDAAQAVDLVETGLDGLNKNTGEKAFSLPEGIHFREKAATGEVAALFSGQGSPYLNMGKDLVWNFPPVEEGFAKMDALFEGQPERLSQIVYPAPVFSVEEKKAQETKLQLTENAQPAIGVFSRGLYRLLEEAGFKPAMAGGHSFGELTALWAAGVLSEADYLQLAFARGQAMKAQDGIDAGGMMAVMGQVEGIEEQITEFKDLKAANYNSKKQVVIAGPKDQLEQAGAKLKAQKFSVVMLGVSAAFHTPLVGHAQKPFAQAIKKAKFLAPKLPVYSNATGQAHDQDPKKIQQAMEAHILESVRFVEEIEAMYQAGARIFVEFGPQSILSKLVGNILSGKEHQTVALNASAKSGGDLQLRKAYAELKVLGLGLGQLDPYALRQEPKQIKPSPAAVTLTGANYVSPQTRKAYQDALNDGHRACPKVAPSVTPSAPQPKPVAATAPQVEPPAPAPQRPYPSPEPMKPSNQEAIEAINQSLKDFQAHQAETVRVHEQFLVNQNEYSRAFFEVLKSPAATQLAAQIEGFTQHQSETLRIHESYLKNQADFAEKAFGVIEQQQAYLGGAAPLSSRPAIAAPAPRPSAPMAAPAPQPAAPQPVSPPAAASQPKPTPAAPIEPQPVAPQPGGDVQRTLLEVVAEKTGYQAEMLDMSMDLESDLGIDSIKRVEILYAMQEKLPQLGQVNPDSLAELRTLGEIAQELGGSAPSAPTPASEPGAQPSGNLHEQVLHHLLAVVSQKTGYAHEMLEPDMDLESDLGIDSIKRVEILYGIQEKLPQLGQVNPDSLAELRTLGEIAEALGQVAPAASAPAPQPQASASAPAAGGALEIESALMAVVAEKTGYQAEMLDMSMDLESDLGIDSIKRVEILYALQEKLPQLGEVNPEALAELRTLGQIAEQLGGSSNAAPAPLAPAPAPSAPAPSGGLEVPQALMAVVAEKTGYQAEMLDMSMDLESDLGIDSIKRVEILYALQEKLPQLGQVNPEALAELRTLGQIAEQLGGSAAPAPAQAPSTPPATAPAPEGSLDVHKALMAVVAEKTGYQAEMLDLSMDLESDLGIDSIKRVEILYALQEKLPQLGQVNPEALAELRTLGQIAEQLGQGQALARPETASSTTEAPEPGGEETEAALLEVVAAKTGYQAEMLDLSMDLESDLGIDSIKRVEILYALQEKLPALGEVNPESLAELRTLGEIAQAVKKKSPDLAPQPTAPVQGPQVGRLPVSLRALARPDRLNVEPPAGRQILLSGDAQQAAKLAPALKQIGWAEVSFLQLPGLKGTKKLSGAKLEATGDDALKSALDGLRQQMPIGGLIHLHPQYKDQLFDEGEAGVIEAVFFLAKHLKADLTEAAGTGRACFLAVTSLDGRLGFKPQAAFSSLASGLSGLTKTLQIEWPQVFCRRIDLAPGVEPSAPILAEYADADLLLNESGWDKSGRWGLKAAPEPFNAELDPPGVGEVFLVSGGAKGVTAQCVKSLAQASGASFLLLGRSPLGEEPAWAQGLEGDALKPKAMDALKAQGEKPTPVKINQQIAQVEGLREIKATLAAIEASGGRALYAAADVTDPKAIAQALAQTGLGPVTGLIHGAGVLADKLIENKTQNDFAKVFSTKVWGLKALLEAVDADQLNYLALFSSSAGFYGNQGQSDYALANEVLNQAARSFAAQHPKARVVSFNWGPWEGGMVTPALKKAFEARGVEVIPIEAGARTLLEELSSQQGPSQLVVGSGMVAPERPKGPLETYLIERDMEPTELSAFKDHRINQKPVLPMVFALAWMAEGAAKLYRGYHIAEVKDIKVLKGVVLEGQTRFTLDLKETQKGDQGLWLEAKLTSPGKKLPMIHYSARINLEMGPPPKARHAFAPRPGADAAELYRNGTLFHGPLFQGIQEVIEQSEDRLVLRCRLDGGQSLGPFEPVVLNPLADDQSLQALLVQARHLTGNASLPLSIESFHPFAPAPLGQPFYLSLTVREADSGRLKADVSLMDEQGHLFSEMIGAEVTISENLNQKF